MDNINPSYPNNMRPQSSSVNPIIIMLLVILISAISSLLTYILVKPQQTTPIVQTDKPTPSQSKSEQKLSKSEENIWVKPVSSKKGYPIVKTEGENTKKLYIYSLSSKTKRLIDIPVAYGGGAAGLGQSDPWVSPDLFYTAFINKETGNLFLLSNETLEKKQVTTNGGIGFITGWSPDSKNILYSVGNDTISTRIQGPIQYPPLKLTFKKILDSGYFIFNIDSGKTTKLYPVEYIEGFIDNENLLVRMTEQSYNDYLVVFNINSFEANYALVKEKFGFGANQFNFTRDGKKWVFTLSRNPTTDANIIYADFPQKEGMQIDSGKWAEVQFPLISPKGTKIAYVKEEGFVTPGTPRFIVWSYLTADKTKKRLTQGKPELWIDETILIISDVNYDKNEKEYYILDTESGKTEKMD